MYVCVEREIGEKENLIFFHHKLKTTLAFFRIDAKDMNANSLFIHS